MSEKRLTVLFVDDEENILGGLRRLLRGMANAWEMVFCDGGTKALALLAERPFDVVVSDMRMPGMDGAQLLGAVQKLYPGTIRVILSGYADQTSVLRTVGPAHVYLAKPCTPEKLVEAIARPLALRELLAAPTLRKVLSGLSTLPSAPGIFLALEKEIRSPQSSVASVAAVIAQDVAMTAEILKLTNSAYFSVSAKVTSPFQAVRLLGVETVESLVLQVGIFRQFAGHGATAPMIVALNDYSLRIASLAEAIAEAEGESAQAVKAAYCAGMLSCVGCLVLLERDASAYGAAMARVGSATPVHAAETAVLGAGHTHAGAYLLGLWGFESKLVEAVAHSCAPSASPSREFTPLTAVHAARALGPRFPLLLPGRTPPDILDDRYLRECGLDRSIDKWRALADARHVAVTT